MCVCVYIHNIYLGIYIHAYIQSEYILHIYIYIYVGRSYILRRTGIVASLLNNTRRVYVCIRALYIKPKLLALHIKCRKTLQ